MNKTYDAVCYWHIPVGDSLCETIQIYNFLGVFS